MKQNFETVDTVQGRLEVLNKSLISEENSVQYYETSVRKDTQRLRTKYWETPHIRRTASRGKKHVATIQALLDYWESKLDELKAS